MSSIRVASVACARQRLVVLFPRPGTDAREKLDLLRVIGLQDLTAEPSNL